MRRTERFFSAERKLSEIPESLQQKVSEYQVWLNEMHDAYVGSVLGCDKIDYDFLRNMNKLQLQLSRVTTEHDFTKFNRDLDSLLLDTNQPASSMSLR